MSEQPNLPVMRPLDEIIFTDMADINTYYHESLDMIKFKKLHEEGVYLLNIIIEVHVEDGNIEVLNEILKITDNHWIILTSIIEYSITSKNMDIYNFINYLKLFLNSSTTCVRFRNKYDNQTIISEFCKELYKYTPYRYRSFNFIDTFKNYKKGIDRNHVSLEHLLATIEKFSPPDVKSAGKRK